MTEDVDLLQLHHSLVLAKTRRGYCAPNPSVGAVIVNEGEIIARGCHLAAGAPHAEIDALNKVTSIDLSHATLYVTLEPCCHFGKTPPCTDAIIKSGIKRVIYGYRDPNPIVAGKGEAALRAAGIICEHVFTPEITAFYESYSHWHKTSKPFVTAKIALSLDGKIAGKESARIQITGEGLKVFTHNCRSISDAILTSAKTIIQDDPLLNVRNEDEITAKPLYILDSELNLPLDAKIFKTAKSIALFHAKNITEERKQALTHLGARCIEVESNKQGLDLNQVLSTIGQDGIHDLWIEAGGECFSAFATQKLLQRAYIYVAPKWIGEGKTAFPQDFSLDTSACQLQWQQVGTDVLCEIHW